MQSNYNLRHRHSSQPVQSHAKSLSSNDTLHPLKSLRVAQTLNMEDIKEDIENRKKQIEQSQLQGENGKEKEHPVISITDFSAVVNMEEKLNLLMVAINKINTNFHLKFEELNKKLYTGDDAIVNRLSTCENSVISLRKTCESIQEALDDEQSGALPRLRDAETAISDLQERIDTLESQKVVMQDELFTLKGVVQVHDRKHTATDKRVIDLTAHSMKNNIIIHGLDGDEGVQKEKCIDSAKRFFEEKMLMEIHDKEILVAHRMGQKRTVKPRPMIVRCSYPLRSRIFDYTKNLKDRKNNHDEFYRVTMQLPEPLFTQNQEKRQKMADVKKLNSTLEDHKKIKMEVKGGLLYLNGKAQKKHISPPTVADIVNVPEDIQAKMDNIKFEQSDTVSDKGSYFTGFATKASNSTEVRLAYKRIKQIVPEADHIVMVYSVKQYLGCHDNGEHAAGMKLQRILMDRNTKDTVVFVMRVFGGIHIGPKRFILIEKVARQALDILQ